MKVVRVLTAVALVGVAVVHLRIASTYTSVGTHPLALSDQFYLQAVGAFVLGAALLVRPHWLVWAATVGFAAVSLGALVYSRYHCLPIPGYHHCWRESWQVEGARPAAVFEVAALVLALGGFLVSWAGRAGKVSAGSAGG